MSAAMMRALLFCSLVLMVVNLPASVTSAQRTGRNYDRDDDNAPQEYYAEPRKRPFCNAFTGCGRKRSSPPLQQFLQEQSARKSAAHHIPADDSIEALLDLSSEPAVEDLSRQILSEAKMWEAIQEASAEIQQRKNQQNQNILNNNLYGGGVATQ